MQSDLPVEPGGDPEADEEFLQPTEHPAGVEEAWEDEDAMEGEAPSG